MAHGVRLFLSQRWELMTAITYVHWEEAEAYALRSLCSGHILLFIQPQILPQRVGPPRASQ